MIEENHMYIRIASNDFFAVSKDVVSKMISGEYDAEQAYQSFNAQLLEEESTSENISVGFTEMPIPTASIAVGEMLPILLWQTLCAAFTGRMC